MYLEIEQSLQSSHPPFEIKINVHMVNCHLDSLRLPLTIFVLDDLVMHLVFLVSH